jgi:hypothetical protein
MAIGRASWQLMMQISPIFLQGGLVKAVPGGMLPIILATEVLNFPMGILTSGTLPNLDDSFCQFQPSAGAMVINQQMATYPFANMTVAANSIITQPLQISFQMTCPARGPVGYWAKLAKMQVLIEVLLRHNREGGSYALITPSYVYFNCIMKLMRDGSSGQTKQIQNVWVLDFEKPLLTMNDAKGIEQRLSNILKEITGGQRINGIPQTTSLTGAVGATVPTTTPVVVPAPNVLGGGGGP